METIKLVGNRLRSRLMPSKQSIENRRDTVDFKETREEILSSETASLKINIILLETIYKL